MASNSNNTEVFFLLVRAGLFGRTEGIEGVLPDDVEWEEVYQLAKEQCVIGLVAEGIETAQAEWLKTHGTPLVPKKWALKFASGTAKLEQRNLNMNRFVAQLIYRLRKNGIYALSLKGQGLAQCYISRYGGHTGMWTCF